MLLSTWPDKRRVDSERIASTIPPEAIGRNFTRNRKVSEVTTCSKKPLKSGKTRQHRTNSFRSIRACKENWESSGGIDVRVRHQGRCAVK